MLEIKFVVDTLSLLTAGATFIDWIGDALPPLAALASIFWIGFQWYYSAPMKKRREQRSKSKR